MYDVIIKNGMIIDGKKTRMYRGDVGIAGDSIETIGDLSQKEGKQVIDASNYYVCPGFVDITNHSDTHWTIFSAPSQESLLRQGITTILGGLCGSSLAPLVKSSDISSIQKWTDISEVNINWTSMKEFLDEMEKHPLGVNFGTLVGHGTLRRNVMGEKNLSAEKEELDSMKYLLTRSVQEGAYGLSFGLTFSHGRPAKDDELAELAAVVAAEKGFTAIHLRDEGKNLLPSVTEAIRIVRSSGVSLQISHFKAVGREAWQDLPAAFKLIQQAREEGLPISIDVFPYTRTGSLLYALLPPWARDGGKDAILKRLDSSQDKRLIINDLENATLHYERIIIASAKREKSIVGKSIEAIAKNFDVSPQEALLYILTTNDLAVTIFGETLQESDVASILQEPYAMFSSDGYGVEILSAAGKGDLVHPRSFGATARLLGYFVRDKQTLGWEEAVHKMTQLPAEKIGLQRRGLLAPKYFADIAVIDPERVADAASFEQPFKVPEGIGWVLVNGAIAMDDKKFTGIKKGSVLRK